MKPFKNFSSHLFQTPFLKFPGILVDFSINDHPRTVTDFHFCTSQPKKRNQPHLVALSRTSMNLLGLDYDQVLKDINTPFILSGSMLPEGSHPLCHNYCGHQFGVWAGQLGDGRAHLLGNIKKDNVSYEIQLKGSGLSPFSRHADGNSVVSSGLRQFLASELMVGLKIKTTRVGSLVIANEQVLRDPLYNGIIKKEKAAIVSRIGETFLRFGSFQVCNKGAQMDTGNPFKNRLKLKPLADYLISNYYKEIDEEEGDIYEEMFKIIMKDTAKLVANWQAAGFVHGVLNTDNMSMLSLTIDYGPFGFIDYFSKDYVSNLTDQYERYSYRRQPAVIKWNLQRLAQGLDFLVPASILNDYLQKNYTKVYESFYDEKMSKKLGLENNEKTKKVVEDLFEVMHICRSHFTNVFRVLSSKNTVEQKINLLIQQSLPTQNYIKSLRFFPNLTKTSPQTFEKIISADPGFNPFFIKEQFERQKMLKTLEKENCMQRTQRERQLWKNWILSYEQMKPNYEISSSETIKYVLLNSIGVKIREEVENLEQQEQRKLLDKIINVFTNPYQYNEWFEEKYWKERSIPIKLTCSS